MVKLKMLFLALLIAVGAFAFTPGDVYNDLDFGPYELHRLTTQAQTSTQVGDTITGTGSQEIIVKFPILKNAYEYILVMDSINGGSGSAVPDSIDVEILVDTFDQESSANPMYRTAVDTIENAGGGAFYLGIGRSVIGSHFSITLRGTVDNDVGPGVVVINKFHIVQRRPIEIMKRH